MRSRTLRSIVFSMLRSCAGLNSLSKITTSARTSSHDTDKRSSFPLPRNVAGSGFARSCMTRSTTSAPAAEVRPANSSSECSGSNRREGPLIKPTSAARSSESVDVDREAVWRVTRRILARAPMRSRRRAAAAARRV